MIITADEYRSMGFSCEDEVLLESCLLRAEYTLMGLTEGRITKALAAGGMAAEYVKQAAAFQTCKLVKQEQQIAIGSTEKITLGDYSYSSGTESSAAEADDTVYDLSMQTVRLLRAAGCMYGGREVSQ
ncbi:MAG: hypothetical protein IJZ47_10530 [Oscillospiraceae bacterium]|nr:hypothetical protein [Oscillospiraceae bacterium]